MLAFTPRPPRGTALLQIALGAAIGFSAALAANASLRAIDPPIPRWSGDDCPLQQEREPERAFETEDRIVMVEAEPSCRSLRVDETLHAAIARCAPAFAHCFPDRSATELSITVGHDGGIAYVSARGADHVTAACASIALQRIRFARPLHRVEVNVRVPVRSAADRQPTPSSRPPTPDPRLRDAWACPRLVAVPESVLWH